VFRFGRTFLPIVETGVRGLMLLQIVFLPVARRTLLAEMFTQFGWQMGLPVTFGVVCLRRDLVAIFELASFSVTKFEPLLVVSIHVVLVPKLFLT
jgi:hypothetical protein